MRVSRPARHETVARELLRLPAGGRLFQCPECRESADVEEALRAKVFIATELLGLDLDRAAALLMTRSLRMKRGWSASLWTLHALRHPIDGLATLATADTARCHRCTLARADALLATSAANESRWPS